jgi:hypothetical protein
MDMIIRELPHLTAAINEESWQWLQDNTPLLADALRQEVDAGASADEIRQAAMRMTQRPALALRLRQAAAYLRGEE